MDGEDLPIPVSEETAGADTHGSGDDGIGVATCVPPPSPPTARHSRPALNFSRPRPASSYEQPKLRRETSSVQSIQAFHDPNAELFDPHPTDSQPSTPSAAGEFTWDAETGELKSNETKQPPQKKRDAYFDEIQRATQGSQPRGPPRVRTPSNATQTTSSSSSSSSKRRTAELPAEVPPLESREPRPRPGPHRRVSSTPKFQPRSILKNASQADRSSSQASTSSLGETTGSHHTISTSSSLNDGGDGKGYGVDGNWTSSNYDISGMSEEKIKKLEKKGINPKLYAEMKGAGKKGKGKRWVGTLTGNSFIA
ncbi:hypothetical protein K431DRAFT_284832 [Polychaeton citri CBS 116435]|uniref:Uncharacterized protein n=1 Tax=Polychaeton citri CBS 116435 TaxID=1314669 RepID=A0A9P4UQW4_9PEZI|nr:hypothetical protein K431DRAFT_284832 [Polychaeton citri CBS 116435]